MKVAFHKPDGQGVKVRRELNGREHTTCSEVWSVVGCGIGKVKNSPYPLRETSERTERDSVTAKASEGGLG